VTGRVTLVGGGPGREDLLTLAAVGALAEADVVLFDRLAPHERLSELAPRAELVDVGKRPGHHAVPQAEIEALLVAHALAGRHAVRLKGGDPYVLGRGSEEVLACHHAGVHVEVIPGVTSAVAVPGAAGIPLTHRGISHLFTVVSGHAPLTDSELAHLAGLGGTIVVLMGVNSLPSLTAGLARHGMPAGMPVAIIERGFSAGQRTTIGDLTGIVVAAGRAHVTSPAVVVVGEVVRLAHDGDVSAAELMERAAGFAAVSP
jgi:uroporphyrin-III C-methyltransferase